jgi:polyhydroxyalkanoate synthesis regulator protein
MAASDDDLKRKFEELDEQMNHLADILSIMVDKMTRIEEATVDMEKGMREEIDDLKEDLDFDKKRKT